MISFIVSVYDRPQSLNACLATLGLQNPRGEVSVCANSTDEGVLAACKLACVYHDAEMFYTGKAGAKTCYESAGMIATRALGEWLCFPSCDSLYVQGFSEIMLETAEKTGAGLVYCDCVYRVGSEQNPWPPYKVLTTAPMMCRIDKTNFIVRRELFKGFPPHPKGWCDGALIEQLIAQGVKHAKAPGVLCVHQ